MQNKMMVFIDSRVADHSTLIAGLGADSELVWLDATQDGLQQMQAALADQRDLASIRILAHGRPGALRIGAGELTRERASLPMPRNSRRSAGRWALMAMCRSTAARSARVKWAVPSCRRWRKPAERMSRLLQSRSDMPIWGVSGGSMSARPALRN
jgi:hypothetical protein